MGWVLRLGFRHAAARAALLQHGCHPLTLTSISWRNLLSTWTNPSEVLPPSPSNASNIMCVTCGVLAAGIVVN